MEKKETITMKGDQKHLLKHFLKHKYLRKDRRYCIHKTRPQCYEKDYPETKKKNIQKLEM